MNIIIDDIEFAPVYKHEILIPHIFVSQCAKMWNNKTKRYLKPTKDYQRDKSIKCLGVNILTEGKPFWNAGHQYKEKKNTKGFIELRIKLHIAVKTSWDPYRNYLEMLSKKELIDLAVENMMIDHDDDNPCNNELTNCIYSTSRRNSDIRKKLFKS